jgi:hypothetical protein
MSGWGAKVSVGSGVGGIRVRMGMGVADGGVGVKPSAVAVKAAPAVRAMMVGSSSSGNSVEAGGGVGTQPAKNTASMSRIRFFRSMGLVISHKSNQSGRLVGLVTGSSLRGSQPEATFLSFVHMGLLRRASTLRAPTFLAMTDYSPYTSLYFFVR